LFLYCSVISELKHTLLMARNEPKTTKLVCPCLVMLTEEQIKTIPEVVVFWAVALCSKVDGNQRFGGRAEPIFRVEVRGQ